MDPYSAIAAVLIVVGVIGIAKGVIPLLSEVTKHNALVVVAAALTWPVFAVIPQVLLGALGLSMRTALTADSIVMALLPLAIVCLLRGTGRTKIISLCLVPLPTAIPLLLTQGPYYFASIPFVLVMGPGQYYFVGVLGVALLAGLRRVVPVSR